MGFESICPALGNGNYYHILHLERKKKLVWIYMSHVREWKLLGAAAATKFPLAFECICPALGNGNFWNLTSRLVLNVFKSICPALGNGNLLYPLTAFILLGSFEFICPALGNGNTDSKGCYWIDTCQFEFICPALGNGNVVVDSTSDLGWRVWIYMSRVREWKLADDRSSAQAFRTFEFICPALGNGNSFTDSHPLPSCCKFEFICPALGNGNFWNLTHPGIRKRKFESICPALGNGNVPSRLAALWVSIVWIYMSRVREWKLIWMSKACNNLSPGLNLYVPR